MFDFNNLNKPTAVLEIIILMLIAAIIGFVIAWLYWRRKYQNLEAEFSGYKKSAVSPERYKKLQTELKSSKELLEKTRIDLNTSDTKLRGLHIMKGKLKDCESNLEQSRINLNTADTKLRGLHVLEGKLKDCEAQLNKLQAEHDALGKQTSELVKTQSATDTQRQAFRHRITELEQATVQLEAALEECKSKETSVAKAPPAEAPKKKGKKDKGEVLEGIRKKRDSINFARIGHASADSKDDLKIISGIGPFIEEKLNALGIYTFAQISRFTEEDMTSVNKAIEFFPGRILRDNWAGQAADLDKKDEE